MAEEVFEALLVPHLQRLQSFVRARLRREDADDAVQRTLIHAFVHRNQLRCASKFKSWLWSIAFNEIRMFYRAVRPEISLEQRTNADWPDAAPSALAVYERMEQDERLRAALASLAARDRMAIRLVDLNGWSYGQAADAMAVSLAAFKSVHFRARRRLASALCEPSEQRPVRGVVVRLRHRKSESKELRPAA